jgi:hypothetical protein
VPAERFVKEVLLAIPSLRARLGVMEFSALLPELASGCEERAGLLRAAAGELLASTKLATLLLDVILPLGNRLNAGSKGGRVAAGFRLSSLAKLVQTRAATGETFLQFVVSGLLERAPRLLALEDDFPSLLRASAAAISRERSVGDLARIEQGARQIETLLAAARRDAEKGGAEEARALVAQLEPLAASAAAAAAQARAEASAALAAYENVCRWLGEDPAKTPPEILFG